MHGGPGRRMDTRVYDPYCGPAPHPGDWLERWNGDPVLLAAMAALLTLHLAVLNRDGALRRRQGWVAAFWLTIFALFVSPLCALSSALFSARVAHHVVLMAIAAPLLVLAMPARWRAWVPGNGALGALFTLHVGLVWLWHVPAPYDAALASPAVFWVMQATLFGSAFAVWLAALSPAVPSGYALALLLGTVTQMGLLGAALTFARSALYPAHFGTTEAFGLSALADQQLAGLIMWVPAALPYLAAALLRIGRSLSASAAADRAP
jgi:putative membrane protein